MRLWLFHPLIFYPLVLAFAAVLIVVSLKPQLLPHPPAPVAGRAAGPALLLDGAAFNSPTDPAEQHVMVVRDFWGAPKSLRIAVLPGMGEPRSRENGVEIELSPEAAAKLAGRPLMVEVAYRPLSVNAASALAVSIRGEGGGPWVRKPIPPLQGTVRYELPPTQAVTGLGLRAISAGRDIAYGVEITSIRISPRA